jgi:thioredoxin-dependent peroxiredoxin
MPMSRHLLRRAAALLAALLLALPAHALLQPGDRAPVFSAPASLGGSVFTFALADALRKGPVVLYFYPKAFTQGCTIEARLFAEATERFQALGATVIGVSGDDIDTLKRFSVSECGGKFAVAADGDRAIMKAYDAVMVPGTSYAKRASYVIVPDGTIVYAYSDLSPDKHVENTLSALKAWRAQQKP